MKIYIQFWRSTQNSFNDYNRNFLVLVLLFEREANELAKASIAQCWVYNMWFCKINNNKFVIVNTIRTHRECRMNWSSIAFDIISLRQISAPTMMLWDSWMSVSQDKMILACRRSTRKLCAPQTELCFSLWLCMQNVCVQWLKPKWGSLIYKLG